MDVLFGAVSAEARRRDRLVIHSNLIGAGTAYHPNHSFKDSEVSMALALQDVSDSKSDQRNDTPFGKTSTSTTGEFEHSGDDTWVQKQPSLVGREQRERRTSLSKAIPTPLNVHFDFSVNSQLEPHNESMPLDEDYKSPFTPTMTPTDSAVDRGVWTIPECSEEEARESKGAGF